ncbi:zinc finger protein 557-like [Piliocolobus tephrosceles]|uniref:zinc finger protein 557-like n=1 Tax=Piliocolobus tephrosceles TaxID=591936 RepID=UPI000C2A274E|nr:zinc finger protein 557-like [Piliocolobus tephrosceles]
MAGWVGWISAEVNFASPIGMSFGLSPVLDSTHSVFTPGDPRPYSGPEKKAERPGEPHFRPVTCRPVLVPPVGRRSPAMVAEPQGTVMFEEVAMYLTQEEGQHLEPPQRALYQDVILENHCILTALDKHHMVFQCPHSGLSPSGSRGKCHGSLLCQGLPAQVSEEILRSRQSINNQPQQKNLKNNYKE